MRAPHSLPLLAARLLGEPLLIEQKKLLQILATMGDRLNIVAVNVNTEDEEDTLPAPVYHEDGTVGRGPGDPQRKKPYYVTENGIGVIGIVGPLVARESGDFLSGGPTTYGQIESWFMDAALDPDIKGIVLDMDTPGGECEGCFDLADMMSAQRERKPIYAVANGMALSAGYAIASAADRIYVTRTGRVGSVGVYTMHVDQSEFNSKVGVKPTFIHAGEHKTLGNPHEPLSKEDFRIIKADVDKIYDIFCSTVTQNRGIEDSALRKTIKALCYSGEAAVENSLADRVGTLRDAITDMRASLEPVKSTPRRLAAGAITAPKEQSMKVKDPSEQPITAPDPTQAASQQPNPAPEPQEDPKPVAAVPVAAAPPAPTPTPAPAIDPMAAARELGYADATKIVAMYTKANKLHLVGAVLEKKPTFVDAQAELLNSFISESGANPINTSHPATAPPPAQKAEAELASKVAEIMKAEGCTHAVATRRAFEADKTLYDRVQKAATVVPQ